MGEYAPKAIKDAYPIIARAFKSASNGGIVSGGSYGYHVSRNRLKKLGKKGDYSIQHSLDKQGDGDACSALDVLLNDKEMKIATQRLLDAAKRKDPRVYKKLREFGGTLDGKTVTAYNVTEQRYISMDKSHLWHVHLSGHRKYANDAEVWRGIAEVVAGVPAGGSAGGGSGKGWDGKSFPGASAFVIGQSHPAVTVLGQRLVAHGYGSYYSVGPGPVFSESDRKAVQAFQRAQGWSGSDADGYPGSETWKRLMAEPRGKSGGPSKAALAAVARAKAEVSKPSKNWRRLCLNFVMTCWGFSPSGIPSAIEGWRRSKKKKTSGTPPKGAPVYWRGPTSAGHVAISDGGGYVYSNDFKRAGKIDRVKITDITKGWGATYLGWTEDYCGVRDLDLYAPAPPPPASGGTKPTYDNDMEEFLMTADWKRYSTTKVQKLKKVGQWQYMYTTDKNNISFADGPARVTGHVAVIIHGKPGESVYFRVVEDDEDSKGKVTRRATYSDHVEVTITPGSTYAKFPINVKAGAAKKGYKGNWIRVQWHSSDPNCKITRAEVARWSAR